MQAQGLFDDFKRHEFKTQNLYERFFELAKNEDEIFEFCRLFLDEFEKSRTIFHDALSYVRESDFAKLIKIALDVLQTSDNENAQELIATASYQCAPLLHPHLELLFKLRPNKGTYYESYPWRGLSYENSQNLREILTSPQTSNKEKEKAFECLVCTKDEKNVKFAYDFAVKNRAFGKKSATVAQGYLEADAGFILREGELKSYCYDATYHICFPRGYFSGDMPVWIKKDKHPTWNLTPLPHKYKFGGVLQSDERNPFLHIITFDKIPSGLGVSLGSLTLGAHTTQMNEGATLFYEHDECGMPRLMGESKVSGDFVDVPIAPCEVSLAPTPPRWLKQDWGTSNARENLFRLGGMPCWIQSAEVLQCPKCGKTMKFLMQLDTDLPCEDGSELYFGSGGICYVLWCDECRVSAFLYQCT
ncbi:MAG: hypothetical protein LUC34_05170 [Campylobacter sp.]|nr:hypothetical protein [Campylobacter sp.]